MVHFPANHGWLLNVNLDVWFFRWENQTWTGDCPLSCLTTRGYSQSEFWNSASETLPAPFLEIAKQTASAKHKPLCDAIPERVLEKLNPWRHWVGHAMFNYSCINPSWPCQMSNSIGAMVIHVCQHKPICSPWNFEPLHHTHPSDKTLNRSPCRSSQTLLLMEPWSQSLADSNHLQRNKYKWVIIVIMFHDAHSHNMITTTFWGLSPTSSSLNVGKSHWTQALGAEFFMEFKELQYLDIADRINISIIILCCI